MALTLELQKPPHSLGVGEAGKGDAASGHFLALPRDKSRRALTSARRGLGWTEGALAVLSPIRSHPFFLTKFKNLFFHDSFLELLPLSSPPFPSFHLCEDTLCTWLNLGVPRLPCIYCSNAMGFGVFGSDPEAFSAATFAFSP